MCKKRKEKNQVRGASPLLARSPIPLGLGSNCSNGIGKESVGFCAVACIAHVGIFLCTSPRNKSIQLPRGKQICHSRDTTGQHALDKYHGKCGPIIMDFHTLSHTLIRQHIKMTKDNAGR